MAGIVSDVTWWSICVNVYEGAKTISELLDVILSTLPDGPETLSGLQLHLPCLYWATELFICVLPGKEKHSAHLS